MDRSFKPTERAAPRRPVGHKIAAGCLVLFGLPFLVAGVLTAAKAAQSLVARKWQEAFLFGVFAVVFGGAGVGVLAATRYAAKHWRLRAQLRSQHPDAPWYWREDWASGQVKSSSRAVMIGAWVFALFWNGISSSILFLIPQELAKGNQAVLIGLVFPVVGIGLLIWAVRTTLRWQRYGESVFKMTAVPGVIGGHLAGVIQVDRSLRGLGDVHLRLLCVQRRRHGKSTTELILWEEEKTLRNDVLVTADGGIPVYFFVPYSCQPTSEMDRARERTVWRLQARSSTPGVDYAAVFEVPVFHTERSDSNATPARDPTERFLVEDEPLRAEATSRVQIRDSLKGGKEFYFPAARNRWTAFSSVLFLAIWGGAIWLMVHFKAPIIFPIVFGLFGLLVAWGTVELVFKSSLVCIDGSGLVVRHRRLGFGQERRLESREVSEITVTRGMQSGQKLYYDIKILSRAGRPITAARAIRDKREAEQLAQQMTEALKSASRP